VRVKLHNNMFHTIAVFSRTAFSIGRARANSKTPYPVLNATIPPCVPRQVLLRERSPPVADLQRETVVQPGGDDPEEDGQRLFQTSDRDRHVRIVHPARRRRRPTAAVPGLARQRAGAVVLLETVLRPRRRQRYGVRRPEQPVQGDRRQRVHMSERVSGRVQQRRQR